jgi:RNA polymerase sigma factor (sigma-70 family)
MHEDDDLFPTRRSLLSRLKNWDDKESWRDFFNAYWRLIFTAARRAGLTVSDAEDVVQETIVAVCRKMNDFHYDPTRCSFKTWLHLLTRRRIIDHQRKLGRRVPTADLASREDTTTEPLETLPDPASLEPDPHWDADWEQSLLSAARERIKKKVAALTFQIFDYHVLQGQTVAQTCKALGVTAGKVYLVKLRVGRMLQREVTALRQTPM